MWHYKELPTVTIFGPQWKHRRYCGSMATSGAISSTTGHYLAQLATT